MAIDPGSIGQIDPVDPIDPAATLDATTLPQLRDQLIAEKNGAIKYEPLLTDILNGSGPLAIYQSEKLQVIHDAVKAFTDTAHQSAIDALRFELAKDPDGIGYAGKTPDEIQVLLTTEVPVFADALAPSTDFDKLDYVAAKVRGEPFDLPQNTIQILVRIKEPPVGRIWQGVPYCRNLPSLDNIAEALA